jgi:hypothetical protein
MPRLTLGSPLEPSALLIKTTIRSIQVSYDFSEFETQCPGFAELVFALQRRSVANRPKTISRDSGTLTAFGRHLVATRKGKSMRMTPLSVDDVVSFVKGRRTNYYNLLRIINEANSHAGRPLVHIPYTLRPKAAAQAPIQTISDENLERLLVAARQEAMSIWSDFVKARSPEATHAMRAVLVQAADNGGLLPLGRREDEAFSHFYVEEHAGLSRVDVKARWHRWVYATNESLLPFMILIIFGLAGNVFSVFDMTRDAMTETVDVVRGPRATVKLVKHRAKAHFGYSFADVGRFSVPTLVRQVKAMTEPLIPFLDEKDRNALFVAYTTSGFSKASVRRVWPTSLLKRLKGFIARNGLESFSLNMLRTTKVNRAYIKSGNILLANKIARHKNLTTTMSYLRHAEAMDQERQVIANAQAVIAEGGYATVRALLAAPDSTTSDAHSNERDCINPLDPPASKRSPSICADWLFPLADPGLIIPDDPIFLAALLRDLDALREAQLSMNTERFERLYAPKAAIIEHDIVPRFSADDISRARALIGTLPPARVIA